jgi:hypothetical protein
VGVALLAAASSPLRSPGRDRRDDGVLATPPVPRAVQGMSARDETGESRMDRSSIARRSVVGRIVDEEGAPRAGCTVGVAAIARGRLSVSLNERSTDRQALSDESGRFAVDVADLAAGSVRLSIHGDGWWTPRIGVLDLPSSASTEDIDVGDVVLYESGDVVGSAHWTDGARIQRGRLLWKHGSPVGGPPFRPAGIDEADAEIEDGTIRMRWPIRAGAWHVELATAEGSQGPSQLVHVHQGPNSPLSLSFPRAPTISGQVVDEQGIPAPGLYVSAVDAASGERASLGSRSSAQDGTFDVAALSTIDVRRPVKLRLAKLEFTTSQALEWGASSVRLVKPSQQSLEVLVVDSQTGEPVKVYGLSCRQDGNVAVARSEFHDEGRCTVRLTPGTYGLVVVPNDGIHSRRRIDGLTVTDAPTTVRVELQRARTFRVKVLGHGQPLASARVDVIESPDGRRLGPSSIVRDVYRPTSGEPFFPGWDGPVLAASGRTDASGIVRLLAGNDAGAPWLRVRAPSHVPEVLPLSEVANDAEVVVDLKSGGTAAGRLVPAEVGRRYRVRFRSQTDPSEFHPSLNGPVEVAADGSFSASGLAPGRWDVLITPGAMLTPGIAVAEVVVEPESSGVRAEIDVGRWRHATVVLTVDWAGEPNPGCWIRLSRTTQDGLAKVGHGLRATPGVHRFELVPGDYTLRANGAEVVSGGEALTVLPGETVTRDVRLASHRGSR